MSDLISRSELINKIRGIVPGSQDVDFIVRLIDNQPTTYDIDKVVEELKELRKKDVCDYLDCDVCLYTDKCSAETDQSNNIKWDKAIEIVKHGVISDDVCEWKSASDREFIQNPHTKRLYSNEPSMQNVYCNTCGKKIKVVE